MGKFRQIAIDLDIHKKIEEQRRSFDEPDYVVLRRLLGLGAVPGAPTPKPATGERPWSGEGATLPHGTRVQMHYNGRRYEGVIQDGRWMIDGREFVSPSHAAGAVAVTRNGRKTNLNGWNYWNACLPGSDEWIAINSLRELARDENRVTLDDF